LKVNELLKNLNHEIEKLELEETDILIKAEKGIKIAKATLTKMRKFVLSQAFKSMQAEIQFFKEVKPKTYSKLIYYVKLFNVESKRPRGSNESQIKYFNDQIDRLQDYFNDNLEFYHYYRKGATYLDEHYFVRGKLDIRLFPDTFSFFTDDEFSTSHDSTVATILAYDMLIVYLKTEIDKLENSKGLETITAPCQPQSKLNWTGSYTELVELTYALYTSGRINRGNTDIKELMLAIQNLFNIQNDNYYHTFTELRGRKINPTKFMDTLKESLVKYMMELDGIKQN